MANAAVAQPVGGSDVPRVVRMIMGFRGRKVTDIASVLYLSHGQISQRLSGKVQFRADELVALANYLDVEPGIFFVAPEEIIRSRCFSVLAEVPGQEILPGMSSDLPRPALAAV